MTRFRRVFAVAGVLFAGVGALLLKSFSVRWPWALVPGSIALGTALGAVMGRIARRFPPGRLEWHTFATAALTMSGVGAVVGFMLPVAAASWMPLPCGEWLPMSHQPPKKTVAFLGAPRVESEGETRVYVLAADGTAYSSRLDSLEGPSAWKEENASESPTTRLGPRSFGLQAPPLPHKTISCQNFAIQGADYRLWYFLALAEDGTVWECYYDFFGMAMVGLVVVSAFLSGVAGLLSSLALLFERRTALDVAGSGATPTRAQ